jgi:hypothetical protein
MNERGKSVIRIRTLLAVFALALPLPVAIAGCGGGGGDDSGESPQTVLDKTFNNGTTVSSGNIDISVEATADGDSGGSFTASLSGPFQGDPDQPNALPQLDWTGSLKADGAGQSVDGAAEITVTDDNAYITYNDQAYEVGTDTFSQLKDQLESQTPDTSSTDSGSFTDKFKQGCEDAIKQQGGDVSACDFDLSSWFTDLSNDGTESVEGTDATKITGSVDVETMLGDLVKLGTSVPGANTSGLSPDLIQSQLSTISDAVTDASFQIDSGTDDNVLRKLEFNIAVDPTKVPGGESAGVSNVNLKFDVTLSDVNADQTITAPDNAKPIEDLQSELGASIPGLGGSIPGLGTGTGVTGLGGDTGSSGSAPSATDPKAAQAYLDCLSKAGNDIDKINACPIPQ